MGRLTKEKATGQGGSSNVAGGQAKTTYQIRQAESSTVAEILKSKSTATEVQLEKAMALLRQGPKTTIELREHGIMMPAARIFQLKNECNHTIISELVTLYDANGYRHSKCARYSLVAEAPAKEVR